MNPPVPVSDLPDSLQLVIGTAQRMGSWGEAIEAFGEWLDQAATRPPAVLAVLAWLVYYDAIEVTVDEVAALGDRALDFLDEAARWTSWTRHGQRCRG
ncbi:hypothetical protein [Nocardia gipuzkoensis]